MNSTGMTTRQIGELCGVGETTVRGWLRAGEESAESAQERAVFAGARAKLSEAQETKKAAQLSLEETLAIIRSGGRGLTADLLEQNARGGLPAPRAAAPLSGALFHELRLMVKDGILSPRMVQEVLGVAPAPLEGAAPPALIEAPASAAQGEAAFQEILRRIDARTVRPGLPRGAVERVVAAAAGATRATLRRIEAEAEAGQGGLFV
jgi:hypothetical protein